MGREIRRVPVDWEHPMDGRGYIPLFDATYEAAMADHERERQAFPASQAEREWLAKGGTFEEWCGDPPQPERFRPAFDPDATLGWCVYETVSEGTPVSPVFAEPEALHKWLVDKGYPPDAAARFMVKGSAPTLMFDPVRGLRDGITGS